MILDDDTEDDFPLNELALKLKGAQDESDFDLLKKLNGWEYITAKDIGIEEIVASEKTEEVNQSSGEDEDIEALIDRTSSRDGFAALEKTLIKNNFLHCTKSPAVSTSKTIFSAVLRRLHFLTKEPRRTPKTNYNRQI